MKFLSRLDDFESIIVDGNVQSSGLSSLYIKDSTNAILRIGNTTGDSFITYDGSELSISSDLDLRLTTPTDQDVFLITSSGNIVTTQGGGTFTIGGGLTLGNFGAGYLKTDANGVVSIDTDIIEDTLDSVTDRNAVTTNAITVGGLTVDTDTLYVDATNNRVGIGTTAPQTKLHIATTGGSTLTIQNTTNSGNASLHFRDEGDVNQYQIYYALGANRAYNLVNGNGLTVYSSQVSGEIARFGTSTGYTDSYFTGNVGIGTTAPTEKLEVAGDVLSTGASPRFKAFGNSATGYPGLMLSNTTQGYEVIVRGNDANKFQIRNTTASTDLLTITSAGNVGIGTTSPTAKLQIDSISDNNPAILAGANYARASFGQQGGSGDAHFGSSGNGAPTIGSQDYGFYAAHNAYRSSTGAWKHSRTSVVQAVRLLGTGPAASGNQGFSFDYSANVGTADITWTNLMQILPSGNVGIGTKSPSKKLEVAGSTYINTGTLYLPNSITTRTSQIEFGNLTSGDILGIPNSTSTFYLTYGTDQIHFRSDNSGELQRFKMNGEVVFFNNVGIGTTSPAYKLDVKGVSATLSDGNQIFSVGNTTGGTQLAFGSLENSYNWIRSYESGAGGRDFVLGTNAEVMRLTAAGNVGIGTTSPSEKLHVIGTTNTRVIIETQTNGGSSALRLDANPNYWELKNYGASANLGITRGTTELLTIDNTGNVGIGTTNPSAPLHVVYSEATAQPSLDTESGLVIRNSNASGRASIKLSSANSSIIYSDGSGASTLNFYDRQAGAERMRIDGNGNVGIGTTAPTYKLSVQSTDTAGATGTGATLQLLSDTTAVANKGGSVIFGDAGNAIRAMIKGMYIGPAGSGGGLAFSTAEDSGGAITERMRLNSTGNVGIGTTSPSEKLEVSGNINLSSNGGYFLNGALTLFPYLNDTYVRPYTSSGSVKFQNYSGSSTLTIDSSGNVGIGTTAPNHRLDVDGLVMSQNGLATNKFHRTTARYQYTNGYLIATNIATSDNNMIQLEVTGNTYSGITPLKAQYQCYNYVSGGTIIRTGGISTHPDLTVDVFHYNGYVYFWLEQTSANSTLTFDLYSGLVDDRQITAVTNAAKPTTGVTNSVTITPRSWWHSENDGTGSGLDADLLDGQEGTYYLDYTNFSNTPTIPVSGTDFDPVGTDNSTNVTLAGSYDYLTLSGQEITLSQVDYSTDISNTPTIPVSGTDFDPVGTDNSTNVTLATVSGNYLTISGQEITAGTVPVSLGGTGATTAADARTNLGVDAAGTDNSTNVTLVTTSHDYLSISGQAITLDAINLDDINGGATAGYLKTDASGNITVDTDTIEDTLDSVTGRGATTTNAITIGGITSTVPNANDNIVLKRDVSGTVYTYGVLNNAGSDFNINGTGNVFINADSNSDSTSPDRNVTFGNRGVEYMRVRHDGNVGINTTSPSAKLDVYRGLQTDTITRANAAAYFWGADIGLAIGQYASGPYGTWLQSLKEDNNQSFPLSLNPSGGNVGIGTSSPGYKLEVSGNSYFSGLTHFGQTATSGSAFRWGALGTAVSSDTMLCMNQLWNGGGWTILDSQVGTTYLNLGSNVVSPSITFGTGGQNTEATTKMIIFNGGNVAIGTTSDNGYKFRVNGTGYFDSNVMISPASASWAEGLAFTMPSTTSWGGLRWRRERANSDGNWYIGYTALDATDDLVFGANNSGTQVDNIMRMTKAGNVGVGTNAPAAKLEVAGTVLISTDNDLIFQQPNSYSHGIVWKNTSYAKDSASIRPTGQGAWATQGIGFYTGNAGDSTTAPSLRFNIQAGGDSIFYNNVGIGTTSADYKLHIAGSSPHLFLDGNFVDESRANQGRIYFNDNNFGIGAGHMTSGTNTDDDLYLWTYNGSGRGIRFMSTTNGNTDVTDAAWKTMMVVNSDADGGKVGIGTTNPGAKLEVKVGSNYTGNSDIGIRLTNAGYRDSELNTYSEGSYLTHYFENYNGGNGRYYDRVLDIVVKGSPDGTYGESVIKFKLNSITNGSNVSEVMRITGAGRVGIGTASPTKKLHIDSNDNEVAFFKGNSGGAWIDIQSSTSNLWSIGAVDANMMGIYNRTNSTYPLVVKNGGNVGIGTTNPSANLHVAASSDAHLLISSDNAMSFYQDSAWASQMLFGAYWNGTNQVYGATTRGAFKMVALHDADNSPQYFAIYGANQGTAGNTITWNTVGFAQDEDGNVGIGITSPVGKLDVSPGGSVTAGDLVVNTGGHGTVYVGRQSSANDDNSTFIVRDRVGTTKFYVKGGSGDNSYFASGNVGIGTTSPSSRLHVYEDADVWHARFGSSTGELRIGGQTSSGAVIQAYTPAGVVRDLYIQRDGGNVGIGTASPATKLHVIGTAETRLRVGSSNASSNVVLELRDENSPTGQGTVITYNNATGETYFNNALSSATTDFHFQSGEYGSASDFFTLSNSGGNSIVHLSTTTGDSFITYEDSTNELAIASDGDLRLTTPTDQDVFFISSGGNIDMTQAGGNVDMGGNLIVDGNVGIGTSTLTTKLNVTGSSGDEVFIGTVGTDQIVGGRTGGSFGIATKSGSNGNMILTSGGALYVRTGGSNDRIIVNSSGNVGINTTNPSYKLDVTGDARITSGSLGVGVVPNATDGRIDASNDIVAYQTSDKRLKENIKPIENALDKVKSLTGVEFDWIEETKHVHGYDGHDVGVIAQEVQAVLPEAIRVNDTGYLSVRYEKMIALLVEGIKEQQAQIDELKARLDGAAK